MSGTATGEAFLPLQDELGFRGPEQAAFHAVCIQGGYSTPVREAYRMLHDGDVSRERAVRWLIAKGHDPDGPEEEALAREARDGGDR